VLRDPPMVPNVIVHCINELESRGLTSIGLYRVSGSESQVSELLNKFLYGRGIPNLRQVTDVNVLASCVKKFLQQLSQPIIPPGSWVDFMNTAEMKLEGKDVSLLLHNAIAELPQPNRDTLAFLMIHLQKVADYSNDNKMVPSNLAIIFGPSIVGTASNITCQNAAEEMAKVEAVMKALLELPPDYWGRFLSKESTPLMGNMAGASPMIFDNNRNAAAGLGYGTMPKFAGYKTRSHQKKFFNPPWK